MREYAAYATPAPPRPNRAYPPATAYAEGMREYAGLRELPHSEFSIPAALAREEVQHSELPLPGP